jgi:inosine/xanthosine triphosphatase
MARRVAQAVLGGTFDHLHIGHQRLLATAFALAEEVGIGLTTDRFLQREGRKTGVVGPFPVREARLREHLSRAFPGRRYRLIPLTDRWGALLEPRTRMLVASPETIHVGAEANRIRRRRGLRPVVLVEVSPVLGEDLLPVSSTRIREGVIDAGGHRRTPLRVGVGSTNPVKRAGVRLGLARTFPGLPLEVRSINTGEGNPQPWGLEAGFEGAFRRARGALGDKDYGVGVEATLVRVPRSKATLDVHAVVVLDRSGKALMATSGGFPLPDPVLRGVTGGPTLEAAVAELGARGRVGRRPGGALGYLTQGALTREGYIAQAVEGAFVPRRASRSGSLPPFRVLPGDGRS